MDEGRPGLAFLFSGNGFIRHQIRVMVATLLREATSDRPDDVMLRLLLSRERMETAEPAPPGGLILTKIGYDAQT
jgi:tRNA pseudouridine38-40 synthase